MFIELVDIGIEFNENGDPMRVNARESNHEKPLLLNVDNIVYVRPLLLEDGTVVTEICYDRSERASTYWVKSTYGYVKTLLQQVGKFVDNTVTYIEDKGPYESPKKEYDFSASNPFVKKDKKDEVSHV